MAGGYTALGALQPEQKKAWIKESIRVFRENFFFQKFMGTGENNIVQVINELKRTEKGDRALIGLVQDLNGSGIVGDNDINGRREAMESDWIEIKTDQLRKSITSKGRVDDQRAIFDFRGTGRDRLSYWRAKIIEEMMFLTSSGVSYRYNTNGSVRVVGSEDDLRTLDFASDVTGPSNKRHLSFNGSDLVTGDTSAMTSAYVPKYGMIVDAMAEAKTRGIKPVVINGQEYYSYVCHPKTFARLKKDPDFRDALVNAADRGAKNPIFTGATVTVDGLILHTSNRVYNTSGAAAGSKWGATGNLDGTRSLLLGAQALAFADIWGSAEWYEGKEDDGAKNVITLSSYMGMIKPKFVSRLDGDTKQDFGVMALDLAL